MFAQCCLCDRLPASTGDMKVNQSEAWGRWAACQHGM